MGLPAMKFHEDGVVPTGKEIFVFGSNLGGIHGAGAAKVAQERFGAKYGFPTGLIGRSWAIPTKAKDFRTLPLSEIYDHVRTFVDYTRHVDDIDFFVTRVGCGLAGYRDSQIAPMFKGAKNCSFAEEWRPYLEEK